MKRRRGTSRTPLITRDIILDNSGGTHRKRSVAVFLTDADGILGNCVLDVDDLEPGQPAVRIDVRHHGWQIVTYSSSYEEDVDGQWIKRRGKVWDAGPGYYLSTLLVTWAPPQAGEIADEDWGQPQKSSRGPIGVAKVHRT